MIMMITCPHILPVPGRTLITPGGNPASTVSSANFNAVNGETCPSWKWWWWQWLAIVINVLSCYCHYKDLSRFDNNSVASCQAGGHLPREHHQRVVPGGHKTTNSNLKITFDENYSDAEEDDDNDHDDDQHQYQHHQGVVQGVTRPQTPIWWRRWRRWLSASSVDSSRGLLSRKH